MKSQPVSRPLSRPSPSANLVGIWKGEPLRREIRGDQVHPNRNRGGVAFIRGGCRMFETDYD
jgi:hypothetical protein